MMKILKPIFFNCFFDSSIYWRGAAWPECFHAGGCEITSEIPLFLCLVPFNFNFLEIVPSLAYLLRFVVVNLSAFFSFEIGVGNQKDSLEIWEEYRMAGMERDGIGWDGWMD